MYYVSSAAKTLRSMEPNRPWVVIRTLDPRRAGTVGGFEHCPITAEKT
jgi:hypothetical protein